MKFEKYNVQHKKQISVPHYAFLTAASDHTRRRGAARLCVAGAERGQEWSSCALSLQTRSAQMAERCRRAHTQLCTTGGHADRSAPQASATGGHAHSSVPCTCTQLCTVGTHTALHCRRVPQAGTHTALHRRRARTPLCTVGMHTALCHGHAHSSAPWAHTPLCTIEPPCFPCAPPSSGLQVPVVAVAVALARCPNPSNVLAFPSKAACLAVAKPRGAQHCQAAWWGGWQRLCHLEDPGVLTCALPAAHTSPSQRCPRPPTEGPLFPVTSGQGLGLLQ